MRPFHHHPRPVRGRRSVAKREASDPAADGPPMGIPQEAAPRAYEGARDPLAVPNVLKVLIRIAHKKGRVL